MDKLVKNTRVYFDDITHSYLNEDGRYLIGVTGMMKKHGLSPDYSDVNPETLARKAEYGSLVHKSIEKYIKGEEVENTAELAAFTALNIDALESEYLVSDNEVVASSIDIVTTGYDLIDIKTTSGLHTDSVAWQLSIYAYLFEKQTGLKAGNLYACHIKKDKAELVQLERIPYSEVEELIRCEREGERYASLPAPSEQESEQLRQLYDVETFIIEQESKIKQLKEQREKILQAIYEQMEQGNIKKIDTETMTITRVLPGMRITVDSAVLKEQYPDVYTAVIKETQTKGSIRIKIK